MAPFFLSFLCSRVGVPAVAKKKLAFVGHTWYYVFGGKLAD
jgi:hypothetical protein